MKCLQVKSYKVACLAPLQQFRVRLEDAEYLLGVGHGLLLKHATPCLVDHEPAQIPIVLDLLDQRADGGFLQGTVLALAQGRLQPLAN